MFLFILAFQTGIGFSDDLSALNFGAAFNRKVDRVGDETQAVRFVVQFQSLGAVASCGDGNARL
ncbi:hypothetical protein [Neisseria subflava]|uniref:hypothetical protein n=1 Tax=Neisseria subflava TaxID=28449 RepID=UPI001ABF37FF|nr:hypothetical protein [Neisseria subflava]